MSLEIKHSYRFGDFTVDAEQRVLLLNSNPLPLAPKVFDTLLILVDKSGRIVEKKELMSQLWPDTFVEESNLTFNIKQLRKVIGDDARQPRFIETVPRRGYRFIAEVKQDVESNADKNEILPAAPASILPATKRSYLSLAALTVLLAGSILIAWFLSQRRTTRLELSAPILSALFKSEKFSNTGHYYAVISPDGKYVAYTREIEGRQNIWLRQLETSENIQIVPPSDYHYSGLTISHGGNSLYFVRKNETEQTPTEVCRVMTFGGTPVKIIENSEGWISLSPDDQQISFVRCKYEDDAFCSLYVVGADGKGERKLLSRPRPIRIGDSQFSPDGKSIAFATGQSWSGGNNFQVMRIDLASGVETEVSSKRFFNIKNLKWLPDGQSLLLTAKENLDGRLRIWQLSTVTGEARALTNDAADYVDISLDRTASKMVATQASNSFRLHLTPTSDVKNPRTLTAARRFAFAPDGKIIYSGDDGNIWTINADGGEQRQLTNSSLTDFWPRVSPDGKHIFFASNRTGSNQVWRMNIDGSNQIQITTREGGYPQFVAPDGKWLYFHSGLRQTLWRVSTEGSEEGQLSEEVVFSPAFSSDGKFVAYFFRAKEGASRVKIAVMAVEDGKVLRDFTLADEKSTSVKLAWAGDNKSLSYITIHESKNSLWQQSLDGGRPRLVADLGDEEIEDFAFSPDGNYFGLIRGKWTHEAVLIQGLK
jgi:Tol biopolymer transport system component/DNA-binding winged helix-turn-helix (wHTH) protein